MRWRPILWLVAVVALAACSPAVSIVSDDIAPEAAPAAIIQSAARIFHDHIDAGLVARAVGRLISNGDVGQVPFFIREVEYETGCDAREASASAPAGADGLRQLARARDDRLAKLKKDQSISYLADVLMAVVLPYPIGVGSSGEVIEAGWVGVIVSIRCPGPPGPFRHGAGRSVT